MSKRDPFAMCRYDGLVLIAHNGVHWRWVGFRHVLNRRGDAVRIEIWSAPCRACGVAFEVTTPQLGSWARERYWKRRPLHAEIVLAVPPTVNIRNFGRRNCRAHLWAPAPERDEELV